MHVVKMNQVMDLECEDKDVGLEELRWIHRHKTGALLKASASIFVGLDASCVHQSLFLFQVPWMHMQTSTEDDIYI